VVRIDLVDVTDFAAGVKLKFRDVGLNNYVAESRSLYHSPTLIGS